MMYKNKFFVQAFFSGITTLTALNRIAKCVNGFSGVSSVYATIPEI